MIDSTPVGLAPVSQPAEVGTSAVRSNRRKLQLAVAAVAAAVTLGSVVWHGSARSGDAASKPTQRGASVAGAPGASAQRAVPVVAAPVRKGNLDIGLLALGTVTPRNSVLVRSRVDGELFRLAFQEGQAVKAGDLLALIDPRPFEVQLSLALGQKARSQALLDNARADLARFRTLLAQESISQRQVDTQESVVRQTEAELQADEGAVANARLQLAHTRVVAPIGGRVGLRQVDPGNVVRVSDANGIVVITEFQPISVVFPIPEDELPRVLKRLRAGDRIAVDAYDRAQTERLGRGRLLAADNQIDVATGTIKLKAEFPNTDGALYPNQFVNVKLTVQTLVDAVLVPSAAIQRGPAGAFVYVVKDDKTVAATAVKAGATNGELTAIDGAIKLGATVVVDGADQLREGARVELVVRDTPAAAKSQGAKTAGARVGS